MSNITEYKDIVAFHPGYYIADLIQDMGISQSEFATRLGTTGKTLSKLVNGQINLSNEIAKNLSIMLGTGAEVWINLQAAYEQKLVEIELEKNLDAQAEVAEQIDYTYFEKVAGLPVVKNSREKAANLCRYFMVSDLRILAEPDFLVNFSAEKGVAETEGIMNSRAWIQTAINLAKELKTEPYQAEKLRARLPKLKEMQLPHSEISLAEMQAVFAECGVAFVVLPQLKKSGVNGAVKWVSSDRVVLAMNKEETDENRFRFLLFHEIKHVLQQKVKTVFVHTTVAEMQSLNAELEEEADRFAMKYLS